MPDAFLFVTYCLLYFVFELRWFLNIFSVYKPCCILVCEKFLVIFPENMSQLYQVAASTFLGCINRSITLKSWDITFICTGHEDK